MTESEKATIEKAKAALAELIQLTNGQSVELAAANETIRLLRNRLAHLERCEGLA